MAKIKVYTASGFYKVPKDKIKKVCLKDYNGLDEDLRDWVLEKYTEHTENPTPEEEMFEDRLSQTSASYETQVFFKIDEKCYFLDFYFPQHNIAIEVDGGIHIRQKEYDMDRDMDFASIGIHTVRLKNSEVRDICNGNSFEKDVDSIIHQVLHVEKHKKKYEKEEKKEYNRLLHRWDSEVNTNLWRHVYDKPSQNKRYLVLYTDNKEKLILSTAVYRQEYKRWYIDDNSRGVVLYWFELPKNPICDRPDAY